MYKFYVHIDRLEKLELIQKINPSFEKVAITHSGGYFVYFYESAVTYEQIKRIVSYIFSKLEIDLDMKIYSAKKQNLIMINQSVEYKAFEQYGELKFDEENCDKFCV